MEPMEKGIEQAEAVQGGEQTQSVTITKEGEGYKVECTDTAGTETYQAASLDEVESILEEEFGGEAEEVEAPEAAPVAPVAPAGKKLNSLGSFLGKGGM